MINLKLLFLSGVVLLSAVLSVRGQIPPAEQLLPGDTIGFVTIPDWTKFAQANAASQWGKLWAEPAMRPFREKFTSNFVADFVQPIERELGLKLSDYAKLFQGQITFALITPKDGAALGDFIFLLDAREQSDSLAAKIQEFKKKWTENGREVRMEKIRDTEFHSITMTSGGISALLRKAFGSDAPVAGSEKNAPERKKTFRIGQHKSLLIASDSDAAIEKLLARLGGGLIPPLAENPSYQKPHSALFRDSLASFWVNAQPVYARMVQNADQPSRRDAPGALPSMDLKKILPALGVDSLESVAASFRAASDGSSFDFLIGIPENKREGIFKIISIASKDAAPPAFVPADVAKFQRTRLDAQKAWAALENTIARIDPSLAGLLQLMLSSAGKDQDPNFDLKKNLIGNLGDDFIIYEKPPKIGKNSDLQAAPSIILIGSPNPAQLLDAMRMVTSLLPPPLSTVPLKEREFLGKKIYSLSLASAANSGAAEPDQNPGVPPQMLNFASSAGYVAFSSDAGLLEEYLRSAENPPKPLHSLSGLAEAARQVGGMGTGYFSYDNQGESMRAIMEALKNDPEGFSRVIFFALSGGAEEGRNLFNRLFDLKLLPSFERISKYFHFAVASAATNPDGILIKAFGPTPPEIKN